MNVEASLLQPLPNKAKVLRQALLGIVSNQYLVVGLGVVSRLFSTSDGLGDVLKELLHAVQMLWIDSLVRWSLAGTLCVLTRQNSQNSGNASWQAAVDMTLLVRGNTTRRV